MAEKERQDWESLQKEWEAFIAHYQQQPDNVPVANLRQLLRSRAVIEPVQPLLPRDEAEIRLGHAATLQTLMRTGDPDWKFSSQQFAAFLLLPDSEMNGIPEFDYDLATSFVRSILGKLSKLAHHFLIASRDDKRKDAAGKISASGSATTQTPTPRSPFSTVLTVSQSRMSRTPAPKHGPEEGSDDEETEAGPRPPKKAKTTAAQRDADAGTLSQPLAAMAVRHVKHSRRAPESRAAKARDGNVCVLTKSANPDGCHIIPYKFTHDQASISRSQPLILLLKDIYDITGTPFCMHCARGGTDFSWNIISMSKKLHGYWDSARFGLRPCGKAAGPDATIGVTLQYVVLPRRFVAKTNKGKVIDPASEFISVEVEMEAFQKSESDPNSVLACATTTAGIPNGYRDFNVETTAQLYQGQIITVYLPPNHAPRFEEMMKLNWAIVKMAAISGAADAVDKGWEEEPEDDDEDAAAVTSQHSYLSDSEGMEYVRHWAQSVTSGSLESQDDGQEEGDGDNDISGDGDGDGDGDDG